MDFAGGETFAEKQETFGAQVLSLVLNQMTWEVSPTSFGTGA